MADRASGGFQESAALRGPQLHSWGARALYLGPAFALSRHRNAVAVVALGLDSDFDVAEDSRTPEAGYRRCRSVLIPPATFHHLMRTTGRMAFVYVDAASRDWEALRRAAAASTPRAGFGLECESDAIRLLDRLWRGAIDWKRAREPFFELLLSSAPRPAGEIEPRVRHVIERIRQDPASRVPLVELAEEVGLSASRLQHLFKESTGVPFRRYRLWIGMGAAMRAARAGHTLTAAALEGGFSSAAHLSARFREMFGVEPSRLLRTLRPV